MPIVVTLYYLEVMTRKEVVHSHIFSNILILLLIQSVDAELVATKDILYFSRIPKTGLKLKSYSLFITPLFTKY
jgi:hypothetical protein